MNYLNNVVVVTGGTRGIGAAITCAYLEEGAKVYATYLSNHQKAKEFEEQNLRFKDQLRVVPCDGRSKSAVSELFEKMKSENDQLHVLINNSGLRKDQLIATMKEEDWDDVINSNLKSTFLMTQEAILWMMKHRYGRIINISSIGGKLGLPGQVNYAASKAGQIALSLAAAKEVAKRNITINNVCPGFIETELLQGLPEDQIKEYKQQVPMKRFGKAEEVAHAVLFLSSPKASYITGATLDVTGGLNA